MEKNNIVEALKSLARKGNQKAQFDLAQMYYKGKHISQDDLKAFQWFQEAAKQGCADAQFNLAVMYYRGEGVAQNSYHAREWLQFAIMQGHAGARVLMASMATSSDKAEKLFG